MIAQVLKRKWGLCKVILSSSINVMSAAQPKPPECFTGDCVILPFGRPLFDTAPSPRDLESFVTLIDATGRNFNYPGFSCLDLQKKHSRY
jgi:hypothetical protein